MTGSYLAQRVTRNLDRRNVAGSSGVALLAPTRPTSRATSPSAGPARPPAAFRYAAGWYLARDSLGNVHVSGIKDTGACTDVLTMKYSPTGVRKWLKTWPGGGPDADEPYDLALGTKGGVYVGGQVTGKGGITQAALLKYQR